MNTKEWYKQHQEKICKNKRTFSTKKIAKEFVKKAKGNLRLKAYECPVCGNWHLSTRRKTNE